MLAATCLASESRSLLAQDEPGERVIVMSTGRVLKGFATRNAGGWLVEQSTGRVQVPIEQVSVVASSLADAYRRQRDSVVKPTPATHLALAQWCVTYRLYDEAQAELRECLQLDPENTSARRLLRRLDDAVAAPGPAVDRAAPRLNLNSFDVQEAESLGGLSTDAAIMFTQRIQPLLINKCGNASCHGTTTTAQRPREGFQLLNVRAGTSAHRLYTERNLAEVIRYLDLDDPALSPLVAIPKDAHGGISTVFVGASGDSQHRMLRDWVKHVAEERRKDEQLAAARPKLDTRSPREYVQQAAATQAVPARQPINPPAELDPAGNSAGPRPIATLSPGSSASIATDRDARPTRSDTSDPAGLPSHNREARPTADRAGSHSGDRAGTSDVPDTADPFDPDAFNRKYHAPAPR